MTELFLDHETDLITRGNLAPEIVCTSWAVDHAPVDVQLWSDTPAEEWLSDPGVTVIGANTTYDLTCQMAEAQRDHSRIKLLPMIVDLYAQGRVRDVQLDAKLLTIAEGGNTKQAFSLKAMAARRGVEREKDNWRLRYGALKAIPVRYWPTGAIDYSADDTIQTRDEHRINETKALEWGTANIVVLGRHAALAASCDWVLHLASCWGVCTDPKRTAELAERINSHLDEIRGDLEQTGMVRRGGDAAARKAWNSQLRQWGGVARKEAKRALEIAGHGYPDGKRCDVAAAARMVQVMTDAGRRRDVALTDAGEAEYVARSSRGEDPAAVHEDLMRRLHGIKLDRDSAILSGDEKLVARADYVSSNLLLGRVERMRQGHVLPLQTRWDSVKDTFRTSSTQPSEKSGLVGEQMQNFPRGKKEDAYGLRETFCPRALSRGPWGEDEGVFIGGDFSQAELHCLSQLCFKLRGYSKMGDLLNQGVDLHWHFAATSLGITIEQVKALGKEHRDRAKPANFGFPGGMGVDNLVLYSRKSYGVKFDRDEVKPLRERWFGTFPEVREYLDWISDQGHGFTSVHPITGYVRGGLGYTNGANHGFQHLCAYAAKVAGVEINVACFTPGSPLFGWRIWSFVHDEWLLEGPRRLASAAAKEVARIMTECFNRFVPDFPTHVDAFMTRAWSKKCETVLDPVTGEILEWLPKAA